MDQFVLTSLEDIKKDVGNLRVEVASQPAKMLAWLAAGVGAIIVSGFVGTFYLGGRLGELGEKFNSNDDRFRTIEEQQRALISKTEEFQDQLSDQREQLSVVKSTVASQQTFDGPPATSEPRTKQ